MKKLTKLHVLFLAVIACAAVVMVKQMSCSVIFADCASPSSLTSLPSSEQLAPQYFVYSADNLQRALQHGRTVLYFWAPWCTTCSSLDQEIKDHSDQLPKDVTILRIEYDHAAELKKQYHIVTQHTFVELDQAGKSIKTWVGGDLKNFSQELL